MTPVLTRAARLLSLHLTALEKSLEQGEESAWGAYLETLTTLLAVNDRLAPGQRGELLTTAAMAQRLGVTPKSLLRNKRRGVITPALQRGRLIRWRGDEHASGTPTRRTAP